MVVDSLIAWITLGLHGVLTCGIAYFLGRIGASKGVRGVAREVRELVDDVASVDSRISKLHKARAADHAVVAREVNKGETEAAKIIAQAAARADNTQQPQQGNGGLYGVPR